ncbi:hypothetical protein K2X33_01990 [bacterium]|nr:hypothetical protein [bacterium]
MRILPALFLIAASALEASVYPDDHCPGALLASLEDYEIPLTRSEAARTNALDGLHVEDWNDLWEFSQAASSLGFNSGLEVEIHAPEDIADYLVGKLAVVAAEDGGHPISGKIVRVYHSAGDYWIVLSHPTDPTAFSSHRVEDVTQLRHAASPECSKNRPSKEQAGLIATLPSFTRSEGDLSVLNTATIALGYDNAPMPAELDFAYKTYQQTLLGAGLRRSVPASALTNGRVLADYLKGRVVSFSEYREIGERRQGAPGAQLNQFIAVSGYVVDSHAIRSFPDGYTVLLDVFTHDNQIVPVRARLHRLFVYDETPLPAVPASDRRLQQLVPRKFKDFPHNPLGHVAKEIRQEIETRSAGRKAMEDLGKQLRASGLRVWPVHMKEGHENSVHFQKTEVVGKFVFALRMSVPPSGQGRSADVIAGRVLLFEPYEAYNKIGLTVLIDTNTGIESLNYVLPEDLTSLDALPLVGGLPQVIYPLWMVMDNY